MADLTEGKRIWLGCVVSEAEYQRLKAAKEEEIFMRAPSQGSLCAPMVIRDTQPDIRSMTDGKIYDSKSNLRKEYKRAGVEEIGTEKVTPGLDWAEKQAKRKKQREEIKASLHKAHSRMGYGAP